MKRAVRFSVFDRDSFRCSFLHWLRNDAGRNSAGEDRDGPAYRRRTAGRLFHRPALFQTGLQVLGLRARAGPALERGPTGDVKRKTKTRARSRAFEVSAATTITNTNSTVISAATKFTNRPATGLSGVRFERVRGDFDESAANFQSQEPMTADASGCCERNNRFVIEEAGIIDSSRATLARSDDCRRILALSRRRAKRLSAHTKSLPAIAGSFSRREQNAVEEMQRRGFSELPLRHHETRASTVICPAAIFRFAHVLPISAPNEKTCDAIRSANCNCPRSTKNFRSSSRGSRSKNCWPRR